MLFNSYEFLFVFLPIVVLVYYLLNIFRNDTIKKFWLVAASLFFYSWWNIYYLPIILFSLIFNYFYSLPLSKRGESKKRTYLIIGIVVNVLLLGYYKYLDFALYNINMLWDTDFAYRNLELPIGISFFTFQQIAFLVDSRQGKVQERSFLNYAMFVTFFPQLIAGPIVHHKEMMPQFALRMKNKIDYDAFAKGLFIFFTGLFKKVIIADTFAEWATQGFDTYAVLNMQEAWLTSLSYTFQLYFDFSGYTDMAIGLALLFSIKLPFNFNSPYKALDIQDFWRRWHMTLSRFLRDYIYIPLGGNRNTEARTLTNLFLTFLIGGIWHGAGWTFVFWGVLHGVAVVVHRIWKNSNRQMNKILAWFLTFNFVNIAWIFFRATSWGDAMKVITAMFSFQFGNKHFSISTEMGVWLVAAFLVIFYMKNSNTLQDRFLASKKNLLLLLAMASIAILQLNKISEFIYFGF